MVAISSHQLLQNGQTNESSFGFWRDSPSQLRREILQKKEKEKENRSQLDKNLEKKLKSKGNFYLEKTIPSQ